MLRVLRSNHLCCFISIKCSQCFVYSCRVVSQLHSRQPPQSQCLVCWNPRDPNPPSTATTQIPRLRLLKSHHSSFSSFFLSTATKNILSRYEAYYEYSIVLFNKLILFFEQTHCPFLKICRFPNRSRRRHDCHGPIHPAQRLRPRHRGADRELHGGRGHSLPKARRSEEVGGGAGAVFHFGIKLGFQGSLITLGSSTTSFRCMRIVRWNARVVLCCVRD